MTSEVQCVSGSSIHSFTEALVTLYGRDMVTRGLARMDPDERILMELSTAQLWVPAEVLGRAVDEWSHVSGISGEELTVRGVRMSSRKTMVRFMGLLLRVTTDEAMLARTQLFYSRARNVGTLTAQRKGEDAARLQLTGWRNGTDRQLLSLAIAVEGLMDAAGRSHPRTKCTRTSDGGFIELTWGDPSAPGPLYPL